MTVRDTSGPRVRTLFDYGLYRKKRGEPRFAPLTHALSLSPDSVDERARALPAVVPGVRVYRDMVRTLHRHRGTGPGTLQTGPNGKPR